MKAEKFRRCISAWMLAFTLSITGIGCLISGLWIEFSAWKQIFVFQSILCTVFCAALQVKWGMLIFDLVAIGALVLGFSKTNLWESVGALVLYIAELYAGGYDLDISALSAYISFDCTPDAALILLSAPITLAVCWSILRKKWAGFALLAAIIPYALCCVLRDTIPSAAYFLPYLVGLILVILTQLPRRSAPAQGDKLTLFAMIPVLILCTFLYQNSLKTASLDAFVALPDWLTELWDDTGSEPDAPTVTTPAEVEPEHSYNLALAGPRLEYDWTALTVTAPTTGVMYLRGQSYDTYTGRSWDALLNTETETGWPVYSGASVGTVQIETRSGAALKYFPYYINGGDWITQLQNGNIPNPDNALLYSFALADVQAEQTVTMLTLDELDAYTALPASTASNASAILSQLEFPDSVSERETAEIIADYVRNSAEYDLHTVAISLDEPDFVTWFLTESDTGYCVHFASAAAVLLRAADIPARYVTGYLAYTTANEATQVKEKQAHAWVEYYLSGYGWTVLEATPAVQENVLPSVPEESTAPSTVPSTAPSTVPEETTAPSVPESTAGASTSGAPSQSTPATSQPAPTQSNTVARARTVMTVLAILALIFLQYGLRRALRARHLRRGSSNRQAIRRWRYGRNFARITRQNVPQRLQFLAEKAAFSQHRITKEELVDCDQCIRTLWDAPLKKPLPVRLLLRAILAI